jgi:hypothetical protein
MVGLTPGFMPIDQLGKSVHLYIYIYIYIYIYMVVIELSIECLSPTCLIFFENESSLNLSLS